MTPAELLAVGMIAAVVLALMAGYPVALTLAGVSLAFAVVSDALGLMGFGILGALPQRIYGVMTNEILLAIPLFIFMGVMLERSRVAEDLLETMGRLFGTLRGGLGFSVVIVGTLLAAAKGVAQHTECARRVAEALCRLRRRQFLHEEGAQSLILALARRRRLLEEAATVR